MAANKYFRWNLFFLFLVLVIISTPIWISVIPIVSSYGKEINIGIITAFHIFWAVTSICAIRRCLAIRQRKEIDRKAYPSDVQVKHIVGICMYKEPFKVLKATLDSLACQIDAIDRVSVIVGLEQGTPDQEGKKTAIFSGYSNKFHRLLVTVHPSNLPGEVAGKCSNMNYAARHGVQQLRNDKAYEFSKYHQIFTTCDCDSIFDPDYTAEVEKDYLTINDIEQRHATIWQSIICYENVSMPFFVRITALLRTFAYMGITIPWNMNPMSVYSHSVELLENGDYLHPEYQMDDIIALIRYTLVSKRRIKLRPVNVILLNGPTSAETYCGEIYEWSRQIRRWAIGAAEVFHYFMAKIKRMPSILVTIIWGTSFFTYYGIVLCAAPIFSLFSPAITLAMFQVRVINESTLIPDDIFLYFNLSVLALQYFWFLIAFTFAGMLLVNKYPLQQNKKKHSWSQLNYVIWLLSVPVLFCHSCIQLFAFFEIAIRGKSVCKHGAAKKDHLKIMNSTDTRRSVMIKY